VNLTAFYPVKAAYFDSNFWVRLLVEFPDSERARTELQALTSQPILRIPMTWLQRVEVTNALHLLCFQARSGKSPMITAQQAAIALQDFEEITAPGSYAQMRSVDSEDLEPKCLELSSRHTTKHGFRVYDLMNVSAALLLECEAFMSFDRKANKLAALEGLSVLTFPSA
jgi:predicted nucleic acid-binding protein